MPNLFRGFVFFGSIIGLAVPIAAQTPTLSVAGTLVATASGVTQQGGGGDCVAGASPCPGDVVGRPRCRVAGRHRGLTKHGERTGDDPVVLPAGGELLGFE